MFLRSAAAVRRTTLGIALGSLAVVILIMVTFHRLPNRYAYAPAGTVQMVCETPILPSLHVSYRVAIDGLSLPMILITTLLAVLACGLSWNEQERPPLYFAMILWLECATLGIFLSFDLCLLWIFLTLSLIPCCALILLGNGQRRGKAVIAFLSPMLIGAACLFVAVLGERLMSTRCFVGGTLDMVRLSSAPCGERPLFLLVLIAFVVRVGLFPFHSWIASVSESAPPAVIAMLVGLVPLTGGYGLLRLAIPLFPTVAAASWWLLAGWGILTILYGGLNAVGQTDLRRSVVHLSVAMSGFACIGITLATPLAANGAAMILLSQALIAPCMLVLLAQNARRESLWITGLAVGWIAELAIPGFLGQLIVVLAVLGSHAHAPAAMDALLAAMFAGMILIGTAGVACMRRMPPSNAYASGRNVTALESMVMAALLVAIFAAPLAILIAHGALDAMLRPLPG